MSAAILFSGNTFQRIKEMMNISNVSFLGQSTFYCIQKKLLYPAIHRVYTTNRTLLIENAKEKSEVLHLLGDGRCDSQGYNAKYGTYTFIDSQSGYILDFHMSDLLAIHKEWNWMDSKRLSSDSKNLVSKSEASLQIGTSRFEHTCENS